MPWRRWHDDEWRTNDDETAGAQVDANRFSCICADGPDGDQCCFDSYSIRFVSIRYGCVIVCGCRKRRIRKWCLTYDFWCLVHTGMIVLFASCFFDFSFSRFALQLKRTVTGKPTDYAPVWLHPIFLYFYFCSKRNRTRNCIFFFKKKTYIDSRLCDVICLRSLIAPA